MVAYLAKCDASEGFNQIIDFLNGSYIKYALTMNPNIYVTCINQFWNTVAIKQVNDVTKLQALVYKKKVMVTEAAIREVLCLDDAEGVDCLPNEEIFTELARMGYEKPSTKLTFYKAFFSSHLVRNVDSTTKFYMYPRFLQLIIKKQVVDLSTYTTKYTSPALTQKVFENMRRVRKGFSGVETHLFEGILVEQEIKEEGDVNVHVKEVTVGDAAHKEVPTVTAEPSIPSPTPPTLPPQPPQDVPSTSQGEEIEEEEQGRMIAEMDEDDDIVLKDDKDEDKEVADKDVEKDKVDESAQVQGRQAESQAEIYKINMDHAFKVLSMQKNKTASAKVQEVVDVVTTAKLITEVVTAASAIIPTVEPQVPAANPEEESTTSTIIPAETKSKDKGKGILVEEPKPLKKKQHIEQDEQYARELHAELNKDIDWDEAIDHVKRKAKQDPTIKRYQAMKRKPHKEAQARKNMMMYLKNVDGFKLDYFKGMSYNDIHPIQQQLECPHKL
nr:hypothetical protein [Tanacetum cinerariifolium]